MEQEMDIVTIDDKDYLILKKIKYKDNIFVFLSNEADEDDVLIKKMDNGKMISLENIKEFELACNIFIQNILHRDEENI